MGQACVSTPCQPLLELSCTTPSSSAARESTPAKLLEHVLLLFPTHPLFHPPLPEDLMPIMLIVLWTGLLACVSTPCRPLLELSCTTPSSSAARESMPAKLLEHVLPPFPILPLFRPPSPEDPMPTTRPQIWTGLLDTASTPCQPPSELSYTTPSSSVVRQRSLDRLPEHVLPPFPTLPPFHPPSPEDLMPIMPIVLGTGLLACVSTPCQPPSELSFTILSSSAARESTPVNLLEHVLLPFPTHPLHLHSVLQMPNSSRSILDGKMATVITIPLKQRLVELPMNMTHGQNVVRLGSRVRVQVNA